MIEYKCSNCGSYKFPDGKGCQSCGASYYSLRMRGNADKNWCNECNCFHYLDESCDEAYRRKRNSRYRNS